MPSDWVIDSDDEVGHVVADGLLPILKEDPGPVSERQRVVSGKPTQDSVEKVVGELRFSGPGMNNITLKVAVLGKTREGERITY